MSMGDLRQACSGIHGRRLESIESHILVGLCLGSVAALPEISLGNFLRVDFIGLSAASCG